MNANGLQTYEYQETQTQIATSEKNLACVDCQNSFIFSPGEQEFYRNRGFMHEPKRCPNCRTSKRLRNEGKEGVATEIVCMECSTRTTVPFLPKNANQVYCASCFKARGYQRTLA